MEAHLRLTAEEVKNLYDKKLINARGLVYLYLTASRKKGWKLRGTMANLAAQLGISERQLYRALKDLSALNLIDFTIHGEITIWATDASITNLENFRNPDDSAKPVRDFDNLVINSDNLVRDFDNLVSKKGLETSGGADSSIPSTLYNSLHSLSPSPPTAPEREGESGEFYLSREKGGKGEKEETSEDSQESGEDKSCGVANSSQLANPSDEELIKFIEGQVGQTARNPKAYARSCLRNDRDYWLGEYRKFMERRVQADRVWQAYENPSAYQEWRSPSEQPIDREKALENVRKIREMLHRVGQNGL
jgi:DNA-binding phage protein